jgi:hypothetical protein
MTAEQNSTQLGILLVPVEQLLLDPKNPRLGATTDELDQDALLKELYRTYYLSDLLVSMARNGYFSEEPLIGVAAGEDASGKQLYKVVEGNRRLTALKLLLFPKERARVGAKNVPEPLAGVVESLRNVPVKVYGSEEEVVPYMGVRHIAGVQEWDAMAKAYYIKRLVDGGHGIEAIKEMVGVKRGDVVQRWLLTLYVLLQANACADEPWDMSQDEMNFSFLYTALGYQRIRQYLEMDPQIMTSPVEDPVPVGARSKLIEHMRDLYGPPGKYADRKVRESRDIRKLAAVYATNDALDFMRAGYSLDEAYARSIGEIEEMLALIRDASYNLDKACGLAPHHVKNPDAKKWAKRCMDSAKHLCDTLED